MKIKNENEILGLFVEDEDGLRYNLMTPFIDKNDGRVWATDGHVLIMVNSECVSGKYETRDLGSKIPVREYNCDELLLVSDLQDAIKKCPQESEMKIKHNVVQCPECNGEGTIEEEEREPTGNMIPKDDSLIKFGEGYFKWYYIDTIIETCKKLEIEKIRLVRTTISELTIVELSKDIHVGIMPMRLNGIGDRKKSAIEVTYSHH